MLRSSSIPPRLLPLILAVVIAACYAQTLTLDFALDDSIVITENVHVKKGVAGLGKIFTRDSFHGFFQREQSYVAGGRYRPLSIATFALQYAVHGEKTWPYHLINVLLYVLLCLVLYQVLREIGRGTGAAELWSLSAVLIYGLHPTHVEAVANCKGRDEILCFLLAALAWRGAQRFWTSGSKAALAGASIFLLLSALSKEHAVAMLAIIPLSIYVTSSGIKLHASKKKWLMLTAALIIPIVIFLVIRHLVIGGGAGQSTPVMELMNNPMIRLSNGAYIPYTSAERWITIAWSQWEYLRLLLAPYQLTHDYYPRYLPVPDGWDLRAVASVCLHIAMLVLAIVGCYKKRLWGLGLAIYFLSVIIYSNIFFSIGTLLSERFLFVPSLGFAIIVVCIGGLFSKRWPRSRPILFIGLAVMLLSYVIKVNQRIPAWKDNFALFSTDIRASSSSAKAHNSLGGVLIDRAVEMGTDLPESQAMLREATTHLREALRIHPAYRSPAYLLGNAHCHLREYGLSIKYYDQVRRMDPDYVQAEKNLVICAREAAEYYGKDQGRPAEGLTYLQQALAVQPDDPETIRLLGVTYGVMGQTRQAIVYMKKSTELQPQNAYNFRNLGTAYHSIGQLDSAQAMYARAEELQPGILNTKN